MKQYQRIIIVLLLCMSMLLAACNTGKNNDKTPDGDGTPTVTTTGQGNGPEEPTPSTELSLVASGVSEYRIVTSVAPEAYEQNAAKELQFVIQTLTGVRLPIVDDYDDDDEPVPTQDTKEIVVGGKTTRKEFYTAPVTDYSDGYSVFISNNRIVLEAGSKAGMERAIWCFVKDCFDIDLDTDEIYLADEVDELKVSNSYSKSEMFWDFVNWLSDYSIVYDGSYIQKRLAWVLHDALESIGDGIDLTVTTEMPASPKAAYIQLCPSTDVKDGNFRIQVTEGGAMQIYAGDYYGFTGAANFFAKEYEENGYIPVNKSGVTTGSYVTYLSNVEKATAYAYNNSSDFRVMFYNVLWNDPVADERNQLNAELVGEYMPDVLGLQEMNKTKRGNNATGDGGLIAMLAELDYVEVVDPRVKNYYATNEKIPGTDTGAVTGVVTSQQYTDTAFNEEYSKRVSGEEISGYGTGGTKVTVDGETFYTHFNCAPLLYNTKTTECLDAGYYWYKNQWDMRTLSDCELCQQGKTHSYNQQHHPNEKGDAASKSATWGVFESLETGERYIVISTHMCTRSDYIKGLQAKELVALINELTADYDYPVILGGDYNGKYSQPNYIYFTETAGYVDVERSNIATDYTSKIKAHHPYPVVDDDKGIIQPDYSQALYVEDPSASVDHIVLGNGAAQKLDVSVYGIVVDEMSLSGADHFPIYIDFSIK